MMSVDASNALPLAKVGSGRKSEREKRRIPRSAVKPSGRVQQASRLIVFSISDKMRTEGAAIIKKLYRRCKAYGEFVRNTTADSSNNTEKLCPVTFDG